MLHLAGLVIQPFLAGAIAFVLFPVLLLDAEGRDFAGGRSTDETDSAMSVAAGTAVVATAISFLALPVALWRTRRGPVLFGEALLWGLGFSNLPLVVIGLLAGLQGDATYKLALFAFASLIGIGCAAAYWAIALARK